jgi:phage-related protein (TIGR01555 family)
MEKANLSARQAHDSWQNVYSGRGVPGVDPRIATSYKASERLSETTLANLYSGNGIVRRVVDLVARDMTKAGFNVVGDADGLVSGYFEERKLVRSLRKMIKWSRLYGGALGLLGVNDGMAQLWRPLSPSRLRGVEFIHVFDSYRVTWSSADIYQDTQNPKFGQPEFYHVAPIEGRPFRVHESRTIVMDGLETTDFNRQLNMGWGDSVVQVIYDSIRSLGTAFDDVDHIVNDFVTNVFKIKGISKAFMEGREKDVRERIHSFEYTKHVSNSVILDADGEEFTRITSTLSGLPEILDRHMTRLAGETGMPHTHLFGKSPAGLNSTGESDRANWQDEVSAMQDDQLQPPLEYLVKLILISKDGPFKGREPKNWKIDFRPISKPSEKETADLRKVQSETDRTYVEMGSLAAEEVRVSRFGGDRYSLETQLDEGVFQEGQARAELEKELQTLRDETAARQNPTPPGPETPPAEPEQV